MKMEALSHQGTSRQLGEKWSVSQISESANESERQIHRYIRLTNLIPELLAFMDEGKWRCPSAWSFRFSTNKSQYDVLEQCEINDCTPSYSQAFRIHKAEREGCLPKLLFRILCAKKRQISVKRLKFQRKSCVNSHRTLTRDILKNLY